MLKKINACGFGILIGALIGLSSSPIVGIVLPIIFSAAYFLFGIQTKQEPKIKPPDPIIIACFVFSCIISVCCGIYIRESNILEFQREKVILRRINFYTEIFNGDRNKAISYILAEENVQPQKVTVYSDSLEGSDMEKDISQILKKKDQTSILTELGLSPDDIDSFYKKPKVGGR